MRAIALLLVTAQVQWAWVQPKEFASVNARKSFWAFQKIVRPEVPQSGSRWVKNPIDAFLLEAMNAQGLSPSPELAKAALIRRVTLDVTGLPPTPDEVSRFVADRAPDAYERLVDRLMASPAYGERWAQRWLDVVRYADTNGFELDAERVHAWRYRDYVIRSFNQNKRFDQFVKEQVAGDELWPGAAEAHIATGFLRAGPQHIVGGNQDEEMNRQEVLIEMTHSVGAGLLAMTVNCARCHNHKFDPILQADYYRLQAVFSPAQDAEVDLASPLEKAAHALDRVEYESRIRPIEAAIKAIEKPYRERLRALKREQLPPDLKAVLAIPANQRTPEQKILAKNAEDQSNPAWDEVLATLTPEDTAKRKALRVRLHEIELDEPEPPARAYGVRNTPQPPPTHILKVGDHKMKLGQVEPGVPLVLALAKGESGRGELTTQPEGRRAELAQWLASPDHPLVPRVFVNRMWHFRMGAGLVRTPNDFGTLGERPTNPKLLDWLASEFVASGFDIKAIDRLILTSSAYRQSPALDEAKAKMDPENKLYWRAHRRRMEAEMIRDAVLSVSGQLNSKMYGRPVRVPIEQEVYDIIFTEYETDNLWPLPKDRSEIYRRTIYLLNKRTVRLPMLANFDQPDTMSSCPQRPASTHALQALSLMNSDFMNESARVFAARLDKSDPVGHAYRLTLSREPSAEERAMTKDFLEKGGKLDEFALALLNRNEFVYLP